MKTENIVTDPDGYDPDGVLLEDLLNEINANLYREMLARLGSDMTLLHSYQLQSESCGCLRCRRMFATALETYTQKWNALVPVNSNGKHPVSSKEQARDLPQPPLVYI